MLLQNSKLYQFKPFQFLSHTLLPAFLFALNLFPFGSRAGIDTIKAPDSSYFSERSSYFLTTIGVTNKMYRDFATSPLFYSGPGINLGMGFVWNRRSGENKIALDLDGAILFSKPPKSNFIQVTHLAYMVSTNAYYHYLRIIPGFSDQKWQVKLGGALLSSFNARYNAALGNSALGTEVVMNFMLATQVKRNISRLNDKKIKIWFIQSTLRRKERYLSFQANVGLINWNYRPGYAYIYDAELNGSNTSLLKYNFANYQWTRNGWRIGTRIDLTRKKSTGNLRIWSYIWDVASAPGRYETFQMASHRIQLTIMIDRRK